MPRYRWRSKWWELRVGNKYLWDDDGDGKGTLVRLQSLDKDAKNRPVAATVATLDADGKPVRLLAAEPKALYEWTTDPR